MTDKQYFIEACFALDLQEFYRNFIKEKPSRIQLFKETEVLEHKYWNPSRICVSSGEELNKDNIDVAISYWTPFVWKPIRNDLRQQYMRDEALDCQLIDASCNDCAYLDRANKMCLKKGVSVTVNANMCHPQNNDCFVHRKFTVNTKV